MWLKHEKKRISSGLWDIYRLWGRVVLKFFKKWTISKIGTFHIKPTLLASCEKCAIWQIWCWILSWGLSWSWMVATLSLARESGVPESLPTFYCSQPIHSFKTPVWPRSAFWTYTLLFAGGKEARRRGKRKSRRVVKGTRISWKAKERETACFQR